MAYQVLSLKWRPNKFEDVIGQKHISITLSNAIKLDRVAHAFTFSGPRGVGKTTTARILARKLNGINKIEDSFDIVEMDAASNRGIDEIRNLNENVNYAPAHGKYKIYIIDEVHMLTKEAFNALLKTLEEPPKYMIFILCTTELHKMPTTIISRTQRFDFKLISIEKIKNHLQKILVDEKINFEDMCLNIIAEKAEGSMRDALSILDQMICLCDNNLTIDVVKNVLGVVDKEKCLKVLDLISTKNSAEILNNVNAILNDGISIEDFIKSFNNFLRDLILELSKENKSNNFLFSEMDLLRIMSLTLKFQSSIKNYQQPKIALDVLMLKLAFLDKTIDISEFITSSKDEEIESSIASNVHQKTTNKSIDDEEKQINSPKKKNVMNEEMNLDDTSIVKKKLNEVESQISSKSKIKIDKLVEKWNYVLKEIGLINSKTANFLLDSKIENFNGEVVEIKVNNISDFVFKGLKKDIKIIEKSFFKVIKNKLKVELIEGKLDENTRKNDSLDKNEKEHPLFMDVLNKFEGEVLR